MPLRRHTADQNRFGRRFLLDSIRNAREMYPNADAKEIQAIVKDDLEDQFRGDGEFLKKLIALLEKWLPLILPLIIKNETTSP